MSLPTELLYEIFGHVDDKATIDSALEVVPDIVHSAVRRIHSPRVVQVPVSYLVAFKRLERTTNVLVRVKDLDTLRPLSHLRGLCVEVGDFASILELRDIFRVEDKRDDQLFKSRDGSVVFYHNSHCVTDDRELVPAGFTHDYIRLAPRCYYYLLESAKPYMSEPVIDIALKYRRYGSVGAEREILLAVEEILKTRFAELVDLHMRD